LPTHEVQFLVTVRFEPVGEHGDVAIARLDAASAAEPPPSWIDTDVLTGSTQRVRPFLESFFRKAAARGWPVERPNGARQDYRNVFPPFGRGRRRIASVNVSSGRTAFRGLFADDEQFAEPYLHNGARVGTKIYVISDERVEAAVRLGERVLAERAR
jgi:hypothetical protein